MEDSKNLDQHDEFPKNKLNKETIEINNKDQISASNNNKELHENKDLEINLANNSITTGNNEKNLEDHKNEELISISNTPDKDTLKKVSIDVMDKKIVKDNDVFASESNLDKSTKFIDKGNYETTKSKNLDENLKADSDVKSNEEINKTKINTNQISTKIIDKGNYETTKSKNLDENLKADSDVKSNKEINKTKINTNQISTKNPVKGKTKPVKEPPIEKKPFIEFINDHLIPEIKNEFKSKGKEVNKINLQKTQRPIAEDLCWVIYCEVNDTCNFWLSFEKEDITSLKSFSLCKNYEKPSIIESFLIDEKKITLKLIISRILQRLNGQKLIGAN